MLIFVKAVMAVLNYPSKWIKAGNYTAYVSWWLKQPILVPKARVYD